MRGYTSREVAKMLDLSVGQVRAYVRAGFLAPARGARRELRFSFQDLVLLRTARGLLSARVPSRKVRRALHRLREQLPDGRPLTGVHIVADGDDVVVRDGSAIWNPESGQALFDFEVSGIARKVAPLARRKLAGAEPSAHDWYQRGCDVEVDAPEEARDAYRRALELDPSHADAHVNLGRLLHETGDLESAEAHYRLALEIRADDATAAFNLGVVLEDFGRLDDAFSAYELAVEADPSGADAHYNLARLCERMGKRTAALRYLQAYRKLTRG